MTHASSVRARECDRGIAPICRYVIRGFAWPYSRLASLGRRILAGGRVGDDWSLALLGSKPSPLDAGGDVVSDHHGRHVDIVKNEWLAGFQVLVAQVSVDGEDIKVDTPDPKWDEIVRRPILDKTSGDMVYAYKDPERFLEMLTTAINSSYLFATEPHSGDACPFASSLVLPLRDAGLTTAAR